MPILKRANRVLAGPVALYLPKGLASTLGRGARGLIALDSPDWARGSNTSFAPPPLVLGRRLASSCDPGSS